MEQRLDGLKLVILDEFSMLKQRELYFMDHHLRQITGRLTTPFGGVCVVLVGDVAQLWPVKGRALWDTTKAPC